MMNAAIKRFMAKVDTTGECWLWMGAVSGSGYGNFTFNGGQVTPHRFSYLINRGEIPAGHVVMHSCDNRLCVNPKHLSTGSHLDNSLDMVHKDRHARGSRNPVSTLSEADVVAIRADGRIQRVIAEEYGVTQASISLIKLNLSWKHVDGESSV